MLRTVDSPNTQNAFARDPADTDNDMKSSMMTNDDEVMRRHEVQTAAEMKKPQKPAKLVHAQCKRKQLIGRGGMPASDAQKITPGH